MKHFLFSFLLLSNIVAAEKPIHDMPLAFFNLMIEEEGISLTILLDKVDFEETINQQFNKPLSSEKVENYLLRNMTWIFNEKKAEVEICTIEQVQDHYQIKAHFARNDKNISSIKFINTCLVDTIEKHSNILNVEYEDIQRTFRLHKGRTETKFELI